MSTPAGRTCVMRFPTADQGQDVRVTLDFSPEAVQALRTDARCNDTTAFTLRAQAGADTDTYPAVRDAMLALADRHLRLAVHQRALARALEDARNAARHGTMGKTG
ncbi:hypothetical protein GCM10008959_10600 [Deinococcus seoulensis]|uniref:Uncharacterized protein n=1 Tax=Deinococcus seoulensis TaxID=1837379 RepID=A0ABQ2RPY9_9DEIO|nr:hypothetical protein GCM10008959_10600 [Deinococcus seoulensis]